MAPIACTAGADMVVLALKKCTSGPPLLPAVGAPGSWEPWHVVNAPLAQYLYELLQRLGASVAVLSHVDGRALAPYQAAVRRKDWTQVSVAVAEVLKEQRTAYRVQNQGPGSPTIVEVVEPRFEKDCGAATARSGDPRCPPPGLELTLPLPVAEPLKVVLSAERTRGPSPVRCGCDVEGDSTSTTLDELSTCISEATSESDGARLSPVRLLRSEAGELFVTRF